MPLTSRRPRVLFVSCGIEDYLADGIFHGLRSLLGADVVDHPRMDPMYGPLTEASRSRLYGRGFTLYGNLPEIEVDRHRVEAQVAEGRFDAVVFANIHQTFGRFIELLPKLDGVAVAVLDGADSPALYPNSGTYWRKLHRWFLPRAHTRFHYFKREWTEATLQYRYYRVLPPWLVDRLPTPPKLHPVSFAIPAEKITPGELGDKTKDFPKHIVDDEVRSRLADASEKYAFADEGAYYADLRASRFGITTKRSGWDCMRHYEIAAAGAVPCFRDLHTKPPTCAPHGLDETNCITYRSADDLLRKVEQLTEGDYELLRNNAINWVEASSTRERARSLLSVLGMNDLR